MVMVSTQLDSSDLDDFTNERMRLPIKYKGMGLRSLFDRRHSEFIGGMIQGIPPLINRQSDSGLISHGRVHIQSMITYLGKHSFDGNPEIKPWETLLSHGPSPTAQGLKLAWTTLQNEVIDACTTLQDIQAPINLLNNVVQSAGFDSLSHKITFKSITKQITIEMESIRSEILNKEVRSVDATLNKTNRECTAYLQVDELSTQFLTALPDVLGIMSDKVILEAFHQYLGRPSPIMKPYTHQQHFIGRKGYEQVVDEYGDSVAASNLRGGDYIRAHNEIQTMINAIFRQAGFSTSIQPPNIFHGKVPNLCLKKYLKLQRKKDFIIPDILVHDHPKDGNAAGSRHMEAIFDVKTLRIDKNKYYYSENVLSNRRAVDTKVRSVRRDYARRAEELDEKCAEDYTTHPFSEALKNNYNSGGVHPIVFGAFGETDNHTSKMVKLCAKFAAARSENSDVTPLSDTIQKGSAYHVMLTQFRRALGVLAVRTAAEIKIRRTTLIGQTREEAWAMAQPEGRRFWEDSGNPFWYKNRDNEENFHEFYAYHTQYDNFHTDV